MVIEFFFKELRKKIPVYCEDPANGDRCNRGPTVLRESPSIR